MKWMNAKVKGSKYKEETRKQETKENFLVRREVNCSTNVGNNAVERETDLSCEHTVHTVY